jgi:thiamine biosynthesis lipoprotein
MGTVVTLDIYAPEGEAIDSLSATVALRRRMHRVDAVFSTYREHSPISRLRRGEVELAELPPEVAEVLALCEHARTLTDGWFDPWAIPGGVDPTGLVKGWSVERALDDLVALGFGRLVINAGGDIATRGAPEEGVLWRFGVQDPHHAERLAGVVLVEHAIATSGTYERGAHLYDPIAHRARHAVASATVVGPDLALADACATALCVAGPELLESFSAEGYLSMVITDRGELLLGEGFPLDGALA